jgi:hypothetical protein
MNLELIPNSKNKTEIITGQTESLIESLSIAEQSTSHGLDFFSSRDWIRNYLSVWEPQDFYATCSQPGVVLSKGISRSRMNRNYCTLGFNAASSSRISSITIEKNGFLGRSSETFRDDFYEFLSSLNTQKDWSELRLPGLNAEQAMTVQEASREHNLLSFEFANTQGYSCNLNLVRSKSGSDYLSSRSANTRQQLRRAKRQIEAKLGEVQIDEATNLEDADQWLEALGKLHLDRWDTGDPIVGFRNPTFVAYYKSMIRATLPVGQLQFLRLRAGERILAYLFSICYRGRVNFLMSGVDYQGTEDMKPGLVAHWLAIERYLEKGIEVYDFLPGTNRYKQSLSTDEYQSVTIVLRRKKIDFLIEHALRLIKRKYVQKI